MPKKASIKYRSLRSNLVHLPLSLYASLAQQQARPQGLILHFSPLVSLASSSRTAQAAYLGWSGLAAASSLAGVGLVGSGRGDGLETVEVDPEVAMGLGWAEGTVMDISVIHNPTRAKSVSVTPMTPDDWEILEQHANYLEKNLLSQLRAAQKGQVLDVWVMGRTKIRIHVDETNPATSASSAVLIHPDTEIFVAPRARASSSKTLTDEPQRIEPPTRSPSTSAGAQRAEGSKDKGVNLRLVPQRVAAQWGKPELASGQLDSVGNERVCLCSSSTLDRVKRKLGRKASEVAVYVKLSRSKGKERAEIEKPNGMEMNREDSDREDESIEAFLTTWEAMPEGYVVVTGRAEKPWPDWADVRIHLASRKGRLKGPRSPEPLFPISAPSHHLAGIHKLVELATSYLRRCALIGMCRPLLLTGHKGSGKTSLSRVIGASLEADRCFLTEIIIEDVSRLDVDARVSVTKEKITSWLEEATRRSPCLLVLDGLDSLLPIENELTASQQPAILADHFASVFNHLSIPPGVLVLATATSGTSLHPTLSRKHVFGETLKIPLCDKEKRRIILASLISAHEIAASATSRLPNGGNPQPGVDIVTLSSHTEGYSPADLVDLVSSAVQQALIRTSPQAQPHAELIMDDFSLAQASFTPASLRGVSLQRSHVQWKDIGGLREPKRVLRETLEWPTKYAQIFAASPLRLRSGILLYGYPGSGKTMLASAVAKECGLNFISVKGPEILNKYIGASETAVRDLFERATGAKPCVLFFDEFDSIAPRRGHDSTGVTDRVVNQLLTEMDGAQGLEGVYVLAATSRPDLLDPALLRPGRLDKSILCDMPSYADRLEILQAVSHKLTLGPSVNFNEIAARTESFSGADLQAVIYNAHLDVVHASIAASIELDELERLPKIKGKGKGKANENGHLPAPTAYQQINPKEEELSTAQRAAISSRIGTIVANSTAEGSSPPVSLHRETPKAVIEQHHLIHSLAITRPSVSQNDRAKLGRIYRSFVADRAGGMPNGDVGRETGTRVSLM